MAIGRNIVILLVLIPGLMACSADRNVLGTAEGVDQTAAETVQTNATWVHPAIQEAVASRTLSPGTSQTTAQPVATRTAGKMATLTPSGARAQTATPSVPACLEEPGRIVKKSLPTSLLRDALEYRIYLPPCYFEQTSEHYPVLYLFHGQGFTDDQWDRIGVDEMSDKLIAAGKIAPLIIVMPHDVSSAQPSETNFSRVILEQLIPAIDETYRTKAERLYRAVGGMSRGGGWAIHFGITYWKYFGALGAHSPAVFHSDGLRMKTLLDALPPSEAPRIYIDIGDRDRPEILQVASWFEGLLDQRDIPHEWHLFSGYHAEAYWSEHLEQYLIWYTQDW